MRVHGAIWTVTIVLVLPIALMWPELIDLAPALVATAGGVGLLSAVVVLLLPWEEIVERPNGRAIIEGYPVLLVVGSGALMLVAPWSPVYGLIMLVAAAVGANYVRRYVLLVLLVLPVLFLLLAAVLVPGADRLVLAFLATSTTSITGMTSVNSRAQRGALEVAGERQRLASRSERIEQLATSMAQLGSTSGDDVADRLAQAAVDVGWEVCGVHVLDHTRRDDPYVGVRGVARDHVGPMASAIHRDVIRTGGIVVRPPRKGSSLLGRSATPSIPLVAVPIHVETELRGVLTVGSRDREVPTDEDVEVLTMLAECAATAFAVVDDYARRERAVAEIERVGRQKQDFLGTVSHELRTPLAIVLGMAETINVHWHALPDERRHDMASRLHANAAGLEHVIEALLDYSRLEAGMVQPQRRPVDLVEVVEGVIERLRTITLDHDVSILDRDRSGRLEAWVDPILIERVVENLVTNACRHTPAGCQVRVEIREEVDRAVIVVSDDGPGIPTEALAHLGERFFRVQADQTRSTRGLGLGLAFCRQVLAMHGSELRVTSQRGHGTTFSFELAFERQREREDDDELIEL